MAIDILIVDEHEIVRIGLKTLFERTDIRVVAEASDGRVAHQLTKELLPHVVLLDMWLSGGDGFSCLARIKLDLPDTSVIMFSAIDNPSCIARADALGASGYLRKDASGGEIVDAIRAVAGGDTIWSQVEPQRKSGMLAAQAGTGFEISLTKRENDVLQQLAFGLTNKEIAKSLGIGYETTKDYVGRVFRKIGVADRTQAAVWAVRKNLV